MSIYGVSYTLNSRPTARGTELEWVVTLLWGRHLLAENTAREFFASEEEAWHGLDRMTVEHVPGGSAWKRRVEQFGSI